MIYDKNHKKGFPSSLYIYLLKLKPFRNDTYYNSPGTADHPGNFASPCKIQGWHNCTYQMDGIRGNPGCGPGHYLQFGTGYCKHAQSA